MTLFDLVYFIVAVCFVVWLDWKVPDQYCKFPSSSISHWYWKWLSSIFWIVLLMLTVYIKTLIDNQCF